MGKDGTVRSETASAYLKKFKSIFSSGVYKSMRRWAKPVRGAVIVFCALTCVSSLLSLGVTLATKGLIDGATSKQADKLWMYGAALAALIIAERVISVVGARLRVQASAKLQKSMQSDVTNAILGKDYSSIKSFHSGELVNRVFSDVSVVKNGIMNMLPSLVRTLVSFTGAAIILITMDWRFVPVLIGAGLIGLMLMLLFRTPMKNRHKRMQKAEDRLHASTQETLENIRVIKASVSEERAIRQLDSDREQLSGEQIRNGRLSILMNNGMGIMFDLSWLVCNLWGCVKIFRGEFSYGSLAAMIQLIGRIQAPIANAVNLMSQVYGVVASAERLEDVIGLPDERMGGEIGRFESVRFDDVSFQYDDGVSEVLLNVNFTVKKGNFVALTGISGGGKTSLFQLLLGIYRPTSGSVMFSDGVKSVAAGRGTRSLFAYVPQGNTIFSGTLRENLCRFCDNPTEEAISGAVKTACIDDLVNEIGMDAILGERGVGLSEGQLQRVAVARALLSGAPVLLLDEATSALDEKTEARMLSNLRSLSGKTCIRVTHRPAALKICDYRLHVDGGRVEKLAAIPRGAI